MGPEPWVPGAQYPGLQAPKALGPQEPGVSGPWVSGPQDHQGPGLGPSQELAPVPGLVWTGLV